MNTKKEYIRKERREKEKYTRNSGAKIKPYGYFVHETQQHNNRGSRVGQPEKTIKGGTNKAFPVSAPAPYTSLVT